MSRRSNRVKDAPPKLLEEPASDLEVSTDEDAGETVASATKPRGKKRKAAAEPDNGSISSTQQRKKVRGKRGILKDLVEMPMDVLFEIFGQLEPLDLLHLARTTKDLRAILMSRSSVSVWKQTLENVTGLPACPEDMSEPQYVNLVFSKHCYFCQRNLASNQTCWAARVRTCTKCMDIHFIEQNSVYWQGYDCRTRFSELIPTITVYRTTGRYNRRKTYAFRDIDGILIAEWKNLPDKKAQETWLKDKLSHMKGKIKHARECNSWAEKQQEERENQKLSAADDRKAVIVEKVKKLGWEEELSKIKLEASKPQNQSIVVKACQKELTGRVLENLDAFINDYMENIKTERLKREKETSLKGRLLGLRKAYNDHLNSLPATFYYPNTADLMLYPAIRDIVNDAISADFTKEELEELSVTISGALAWWREPIERRLIQLISKAADEKFALDPETVLNLASTCFHCSNCGECFPTSYAFEHGCARNYGYGYGMNSNIVERTLQETSWNAQDQICFKLEMLNAHARALQICGFDPKTTPASQLNELDPIIECLDCNSQRDGRHMMKWFKVCDHVSKNHSRQTRDVQLVVANEELAANVRARMFEEQERKASQLYNKFAMCSHCRRKDDTVSLMQHVKAEHGVIRPAMEHDVVMIPGLPRATISEFKLWPPRENSSDSAVARPEKEV